MQVLISSDTVTQSVKKSSTAGTQALSIFAMPTNMYTTYCLGLGLAKTGTTTEILGQNKKRSQCKNQVRTWLGWFYSKFHGQDKYNVVSNIKP